ncbi:unnamed protein product, partial [marine sediment metagenome]
MDPFNSSSELKVVKTACSLCALACGINVYLDGGKIVKVEGMYEHPLNKGILCPRAEAAWEYVYSPERL